ncbi:hypothetical protein OSB04_007498 [Centaurea solstitialis]|uniref:F-box domain-containing protein n=1 Tax=Centaurea solstitialis TaxID=347529 RepID=A0AA38TSJ7_9ASTR|nr:hypothetical protein OSB04_007498 [Centaurea solstitialis]
MGVLLVFAFERKGYGKKDKRNRDNLLKNWSPRLPIAELEKKRDKSHQSDFSKTPFWPRERERESFLGNQIEIERESACGIVAEPTTKRTKIHESMENTIIPDDVLRNILSRLSAKPLMRFRCVSKHWNSLISNPYFMNSRSHRMILMHSGRTGLYAFDPKHQSVVKLTYPFEHQIYECKIIGTLNGIVLLVLQKYIYGASIIILYNPLTRATNELPGLPLPCCVMAAMTGRIYGFCHGNIITAKASCLCPSSNTYNNCNVFSLKNGSWTTPKTTFAGGNEFVETVGMFLNGFLHWIACLLDEFHIVVLDVTEMVVTQMDAPPLTTYYCYRRLSVLGMLHGCLCMSSVWSNGFDVWVREQSEWSKQYSFALPFYRYGCNNRLDVSILEDGRVLVKDEVSNLIIMCHLFERCYYIFKCASEIRVANIVNDHEHGNHDRVGKPFEYVESLVSPSDICHCATQDYNPKWNLLHHCNTLQLLPCSVSNSDDLVGDSKAEIGTLAVDNQGLLASGDPILCFHIHESMENTIIPDDVLRNILSRLSAKPLMRFRCVSKHWNSLISNPCFMNSRSHRMILMHSGLTGLYAFDPKHQSVVKLTYPFEHQIYECKIIGTLNGIVLLVLQKYIYGACIIILYNPLTRATKELPGLPLPCCVMAAMTGRIYGFAHGNIITAKASCLCPSSNTYNNCNVFSLKSGSWTTPKTTFAGGNEFVEKVGMFLNGFLHWIACLLDEFYIVVLDVTEMVVTQMDAPPLTTYYCYRRLSVLGMLQGCLCMSSVWSNGFDVWVREQSEWSKQYSFALPFYRYGCNNRLDVSILEDGRILVKDEVSNLIVICHLLERYYYIFKCASEIGVANIVYYHKHGDYDRVGRPFEYVESLVSPSDICNTFQPSGKAWAWHSHEPEFEPLERSVVRDGKKTRTRWGNLKPELNGTGRDKSFRVTDRGSGQKQGFFRGSGHSGETKLFGETVETNIFYLKLHIKTFVKVLVSRGLTVTAWSHMILSHKCLCGDFRRLNKYENNDKLSLI